MPEPPDLPMRVDRRTGLAVPAGSSRAVAQEAFRVAVQDHLFGNLTGPRLPSERLRAQGIEMVPIEDPSQVEEGDEVVFLDPQSAEPSPVPRWVELRRKRKGRR